MKRYTIFVSTDFGPFEPYEFSPLLTLERARLAIERLQHMTRQGGDRYRYEIREI